MKTLDSKLTKTVFGGLIPKGGGGGGCGGCGGGGGFRTLKHR